MNSTFVFNASNVSGLAGMMELPNKEQTPKPSKPVTPEYLTMRDVAKLLKVSERTVYSFIKRDGLPFVRLGSSVRFDPQDLPKWIESRKVRGTPAEESGLQ